jgi:hypothetical protein
MPIVSSLADDVDIVARLGGDADLRVRIVRKSPTTRHKI